MPLQHPRLGSRLMTVSLYEQLVAARRAENALTSAYPELPLLVAQLRRRFDGDVFTLINGYLAVEWRIEVILSKLKEQANAVEAPADVEDGA